MTLLHKTLTNSKPLTCTIPLGVFYAHVLALPKPVPDN